MTTKTVLGTTVYGTPAGNYDGSSDMDWASDPVTAANYYQGRSGLQTFAFQNTAAVGTMYVEACLDSDPATANWFEVYSYNMQVYPVLSTTITGNFTWMRVRIDNFTAGTINSVTITY
jgi:hypothetical protein